MLLLSLSLLLCGLPFLAVAQATSLPQSVADKFGAKCLDGSPPTYQITRNASSDGWVLFLEGGGWCYGATANETLQSCADRGGMIWPPKAKASANNNNKKQQEYKTDGDIGGIMSQNCTLNPHFCSWNKVFLHYCDGASFGGGRVEPIATTAKKGGAPGQMWMRGRNNFNALISYLQTDLGMGDATEVILSGGSAGALAVFYNLDHLATLLPATTRLVGFPDAGFFLDAQSTAGTYDYRNSFIGADPVWNVTGSGGTNLKCLAANAGAEWKCLMAPYLAPFISTPYFVLNSAHDMWQLMNILKQSCIPTPTNPCTAAENRTIRTYQQDFVAAIKAVAANNPKNGYYVDSCYVHEQNVNYCSSQGLPNCVGYTPYETGSKKWGYTTELGTPSGALGMTPQQAFNEWYLTATTVQAIDSYTFFDNPSCHYLGNPV